MMKNTFIKIFCLFIIGFVTFSCEEDVVEISSPKDYPLQIGFNDLSPEVAISESDMTAYMLEVAVSEIVTDQAIQVTYSTSGTATEGVDYEILGEKGVVEILPGARKANILVKPIDNTTYEEVNNTLVIKLESTTYGELGYRNEEPVKTVVFLNNDCPGPAGGTYSADITGAYEAYQGTGPYDYTTDITLEKLGCDGALVTYSVSDISFGHYPLVYGDTANPGVLELDSDTGVVTIDPTKNPDVVYGGDAFTGSGTFDNATQTLEVSWSNSYGDRVESAKIQF